jgi:hypothetical protein
MDTTQLEASKILQRNVNLLTPLKLRARAVGQQFIPASIHSFIRSLCPQLLIRHLLVQPTSRDGFVCPRAGALQSQGCLPDKFKGGCIASLRASALPV